MRYRMALFMGLALLPAPAAAQLGVLTSAEQTQRQADDDAQNAKASEAAAQQQLEAERAKAALEMAQQLRELVDAIKQADYYTNKKSDMPGAGEVLVGKSVLGGGLVPNPASDVVPSGGTSILPLPIASGAPDLSSAAAAVPEPACWAMMTIGIGLVGVSARRRRRTASRRATSAPR